MTGSLRHTHVVVVYHHPIVRQVLLGALERNGYAASESDDAATGLFYVRSLLHPAVVIVDPWLGVRQDPGPGRRVVRAIETIATDDLLAREHAFILLSARDPEQHVRLVEAFRSAFVHTPRIVTVPFRVPMVLQEIQAAASEL